MAAAIQLTRILRCSQAGREERDKALAVLSDAIELWRQNASLAAYQVILSALDSNDQEVRETAGRVLVRNSPRPRNLRANPDGATSQTSHENI
jgi:hypothetical protein